MSRYLKRYTSEKNEGDREKERERKTGGKGERRTQIKKKRDLLTRLVLNCT